MRLDPELAPFTDHLKYRWSKYTSLKESIKEAEGGLVNFAAVRQGLAPRASARGGWGKGGGGAGVGESQGGEGGAGQLCSGEAGQWGKGWGWGWAGVV